MNRKMGKLVRERLQKKEILVAPGAHDVLTAKIIEKVGFEAVYMTGYGNTASILGSPDVGLITFSEMAERARNMAAAIEVPLIADADTGYGNAVNVIRTTRAYEQAGVAVMQIEDQLAPKKCGHMLGRELISTEEMCGKIRAAVDARSDRDSMLIMARTDARTNFGLEEAIARGKAYEAAGADILFIESVENEEEMKAVTSSFEVPVLANMIEHGRTPYKTSSELEEIGYDLVIYCLTSTYTMAQAMFDVMNELKNTGSARRFMEEGRMLPFDMFNQLIGLPEIRRIEREYNSGRVLDDNA